MYFSPFDALGLPPGLYGADEINQAFKKTALQVHPDKRRPEDRDIWPTIHHISESRRVLLEGCEKVLCLFDHYPATRVSGNARVVAIDPNIFIRCGVCGMILATKDHGDHLGEHGLTRCPPCGEFFVDMAGHNEQVHGRRLCEFCAKYVPIVRLDEHLAVQHTCPLCPAVMKLEHRSQHIRNKHGGPACEDCNVLHDIRRHIREDHTWRTCPICSRVLDPSLIREHLQDVHSTSLCKGCRVDSVGFSRHLKQCHRWAQCAYCNAKIDHAKMELHLYTVHHFRLQSCCLDTDGSASHLQESHPARACPQCREAVVDEEMNIHLRSVHGWKQCDFCHVVEQEDLFAEHVRTHKFEACPVCQEEVVRERFDEHLQADHQYKACPFCTVVESSDAMRQHLRESHDETERCAICGDWQTEAGMRFHLREQHMYTECTFCQVILPHDLALEHVDGHQVQVCASCGDFVDRVGYDQHLVSAHGFIRCPICSASEQDVLGHIYEHHPAPERASLQPSTNTVSTPNTEQPRDTPVSCVEVDIPTETVIQDSSRGKEQCPECQKSFTNLYIHRRRVHKVSRFSKVPPKEPRVFCTDCRKEHSKSNMSRCRRSK